MGKEADIFINDLEAIIKDLGFPEIKYLGNGLYKLPEGIIAGEAFMNKLNQEIIHEINKV